MHPLSLLFSRCRFEKPSPLTYPGIINYKSELIYPGIINYKSELTYPWKINSISELVPASNSSEKHQQLLSTF